MSTVYDDAKKAGIFIRDLFSGSGSPALSDIEDDLDGEEERRDAGVKSLVPLKIVIEISYSESDDAFLATLRTRNGTEIHGTGSTPTEAAVDVMSELETSLIRRAWMSFRS